MAKAQSADAARVLTDIPNIGVSLAADLQSLDIKDRKSVV